VQGLAAGDEVVASAQFLIDSESALNAGLMRMAPTDAAPAKGAGMLLAFDPETRNATIRHAALDSLGWPAMESKFPVRADVAMDRMTSARRRIQITKGAGGLLYLSDVRSDDGIAATGVGVVEGVTADGKLTMNHEPIPDLGWPAMVMDMPVAGVDTAAVRSAPPLTVAKTASAAVSVWRWKTASKWIPGNLTVTAPAAPSVAGTVTLWCGAPHRSVEHYEIGPGMWLSTTAAVDPAYRSAWLTDRDRRTAAMVLAA
jgi:Cu(I)/Ag(I) efflux system membrane fusion protein